MPQQPPSDEPNRVKVRLVFSGKGRNTAIDMDSLTGCKSTVNGQLWPDDMILVAKIMALISEAKAIYPPET